MEELYAITEHLTYQKLRTLVKGKLTVWVYKDTLHIKVTCEDQTYEHIFPTLAESIQYGMDTEDIVQSFLYSYRGYIEHVFMQKYFYPRQKSNRSSY